MKRVARLLAAIAFLAPVAVFGQVPGGDELAINKTPIIGGTTGRCLYDNAGKVGEQTCGGAPTGAAGGNLGGTYPNPTVVTNANLTGDVTSVGNATTLAAGSASNLNSGTLASARGGAGTITGALKGNGAGVVSQAACADLSNGTTNCSAAVGQLPGTTTNDNATVGNVGEYRSASNADTGQSQTSTTVTITIATPGVVTWGTTIPFACTGTTGTAVVNFTTTGALPTGIVAGTNYYAICSSISGNTFQIATSADNAIAGTAINTSGSQSGVQTGVPTGILATGTGLSIAAMSLTAGDWDVSADISFFAGASTSITLLAVGTHTVNGTISGIPGRETQTSTAAQVPGVSNTIIHSGPARFSLSATTTVYCLVNSAFTVSTLAAWGGCRARRAR